MMTISKFQVKEVINVIDGKKLGYISDIEINVNTGSIEAIIIHKGDKMFHIFGKEEEIVISWKNIIKVGEDVILVRYRGMKELDEPQ